MELVCSLQLIPSPGHQLILFPGCFFVLAWIWPTMPVKGRQLASAWWPGRVWNLSSLASWESKLLHEMMRNLPKTEGVEKQWARGRMTNRDSERSDRGHERGHACFSSICSLWTFSLNGTIAWPPSTVWFVINNLLMHSFVRMKSIYHGHWEAGVTSMHILSYIL